MVYPANLLAAQQAQALDANPYVLKTPSRFSNIVGRSNSLQSRRRQATGVSPGPYTHMKRQPWVPPPGPATLRPSHPQNICVVSAQQPYEGATNHVARGAILIKQSNSANNLHMQANVLMPRTSAPTQIATMKTQPPRMHPQQRWIPQKQPTVQSRAAAPPTKMNVQMSQ